MYLFIVRGFLIKIIKKPKDFMGQKYLQAIKIVQAL